MTVPTSPMPIRKAPLFTPYVVVWSMFGALSLGLLGVIGLAPEWLDDLKPSWSSADPQSNQGQRATARLAADINALKDSVGKIQFDLAKVKTDVASQSVSNRTVSAQVTALEQRLATGSTIAKSDSQATPAPEATNRQVMAPAAAAAPPEAVVTSQPPAEPAAPAPARTPKVINADAAAASPATALETGSLKTAAKAPADAISFGPAIVKPAPQPMGIKISSGESTDSLRLSWSVLAEKYGDALKGLEARYVTGGDAQNPNYDLVAGPIKSKAEAAKVCKSLTAKGVPCTVGAFSGEAL